MSTGDLIEAILTAARQVPDVGYNEGLDLLASTGRQVWTLCHQLTKREATQARAVLRAVLTLTLPGKCDPQCCGASYARGVGIDAKWQALVAWSWRDPEAATELPPSLVAQLLEPDSRRLALAAAELVVRSADGRRAHARSLVGAVSHPRWQVAEAAARGLGELGQEAPFEATGALARALRHERWQVRRAAAKALGRITGGKHQGVARLATRDRHQAVRHAACKATGQATPRP